MKSLELYKQLVPFLGEVLGKNSKIVLFDLSQKKEQVIAIANGTLEGQGIGAPLTDLARSIIKKESWKNQDYMTNFLGRTQDGQLLRSSNLFIKENGKLVGLLCINSNIEEYQRISRDVLRLSGLPEDFFTISPQPVEVEHLSETITNAGEITRFTIRDLYGQIEVDRLTQTEKLEIIKALKKKDIFLIKGSVSQVAAALKCSEASIYRYLSTIAKQG
ncbi:MULTISPECIES: helix-turn-helix transcriptional regulator [Enterocloster]|uniref:Predicted transcriptional regulator YheO, contains PAS and DNA-binding HTH domains n=1 Tax=Enterocloster lavalensis TaxID=460384 RepID=A0A1I0D9V5_9FIRM|nr:MULTISPECIES: PAS domain-containing protein [Enterocloster]MBS5603971.1 PAS domain-containing protein [Enterocloster asparagiformis]MCB6345194.1 PAS domain-containing protein [Enterocloster lavalensis]MDR3759286.1 PAS domain-containing protein [Enterocloster sp.]SET28878.1 Predicted transcriptional regulator YheO, contains PAS and DNA-binding HTH domains [Enterocloster lavalensis]